MAIFSRTSDHKSRSVVGTDVAVARALINKPSIILADEPSGNLDSKHANDLHKLLLKINRERGQTIIIVTHNNDLANLGNRKLEMIDGKLIS